MTQILSYLATAIEGQVAGHGRSTFGARLKVYRHKMFGNYKWLVVNILICSLR